ncbi:hypothetical protein [Novosphingobium sp. BW1]|uniref:hypothetical protein n=1 Tax=Novosphingobium sp. BW1 TaxID=2592621 RepID=UPI0011DF87C6|nr:hypothetical protein [Novosphingobium sp. BW1]
MTRRLIVGRGMSENSDTTSVGWFLGNERIPRNRAAFCAVCGASHCHHSDLEFAGIVPAGTQRR